MRNHKLKYDKYIGERFGGLTFVKALDKFTSDKRYGLFRCDCGNEKDIIIYNVIKSGRSTNCGCKGTKYFSTEDKRLLRNSPTFHSYMNMIKRCYYDTDSGYPIYGGRGITVCERWLHSYDNFLEDMGERPEGLTLDRIDSNGNYGKNNCKWSTAKEQANNRRVTRYATAFGETLPFGLFAEKHGINYETVRYNVNVNNDMEQVVNKHKGLKNEN